MATPQREAAAPQQAASAAPTRRAALEGAIFECRRAMEDGFNRIMEDFERLGVVINQLEGEKVQKEAEVQKLMEELEREKAHNKAQVQKVMKLESEKAQKEAQVQKVIEENVRLGALLDKKEAQLHAMSEQCKLMALHHHN